MIRFSHHARIRMAEREISEADVANIISDPEQLNVGIAGVVEVTREIRGRDLRVVYLEKDGERLVITVYWIGG